MRGGPVASGSIASAVIPVEDTWSVRKDLPYFDPRLIVDTCSQFVASSFRALIVHGEATMIVPRSTTVPAAMRPARDAESTREDRDPRVDVALLQVMVSHAPTYAGAERFMLELVPRCKELREQLRQTVFPLCVENMDSQVPMTAPGDAVRSAVDQEVERFLRSRLVTCDLSELFGHDVFAESGPEDALRPKARLRGGDDDHGDGEANGRPGRRTEVLRSDHLSPRESTQRKFDFQKDTHMEVVMWRFELRFWRAFTHGLGLSLFGASRLDLVDRFEASAQELYLRYEGEMQLSVNSLMGWLPPWISNSLFIAFTGLPSSTAARQRSEKFTMLHRCVKTLVHSSGRYIFVSTPSWYLPLISWLPDLGRKERVRETAQLQLNLRSIWPSAVLEPHACVAAVDREWGGHIPGKRAKLQLLRGVEDLGSWVLRMTRGCEELVCLALQTIREFAPALEDIYDALVNNGTLDMVAALDDNVAARRNAEAAAQLIYHKTLERKRLVTRRRSVLAETGRRLSTGNIGDGRRRSSLVRTAPSRHSLITSRPLYPGLSEAEDVQKQGHDDLSSLDGVSLLSQLHIGSDSTSAEIGTCRLRRSMATGVGGPGEVTWPLGQPNALNGRIPIHDSPDLLPTALPQIVEGPWGEATNFELPDLAANPLVVPALPARAPSGFGTPASGSSSRSPAPHSFLRAATNNTKGGRRNARLWTFMPDMRSVPPPRRPERTASAPGFSQAGGPLPDILSPGLLRGTSPSGRGGGGGGRGRKRERAASAPPASDTADFDGGDPRRSTVLALALQLALRRGLRAGRCASALHLAWRGAATTEELAQLRRLRLGLGALLLFATMRAPLPTLHELPLYHFAVLDANVAEDREMLPRPKVQLPDGLFLMGCAPVFHTLATECSARLSPLASFACCVGMPQSMLDEQLLHDVLVERPTPGPPRWRTGCLAVLLAAGLLGEGCLVPGGAPAQLWHRQDHRGLFPLCCAFRFICGLEYVRQWRDRCLERRSEPRGTNLDDFLPFLKDCASAVRTLSAQLDWSASTEGVTEAGPDEAGINTTLPRRTERPLLVAPRVDHGVEDLGPCTERWDQERLLSGDSISLKDFASWVRDLKPGRVVYSSYGSKTADLYWRLTGAVVVIAFVETTASAPLTASDVNRLFANAVGQPEWWGVPLVSYILLGSKISQGLENACGGTSCVVFSEGQAIDNGGPVPCGCEVIVCTAQCLWSLLGPLKGPLTIHRRMLESGTLEEGKGRPRFDSRRWKGLPAGAPKNAVADWRSRRLASPKGQQLDVNRDILQALLEHVFGQSGRLAERVVELCGDADAGLGSLSSSPAASPAPGSRPAGAGGPGGAGPPAPPPPLAQGEHQEAAAPIESQRPGALEAALLAAAEAPLPEPGGDAEELVQGAYATIDSRVPSPVRTEKSRRWRPPTPHPTYQRPAQQESTVETHLYLAAWSKGDQEPPPFDFIGFGDWRTAVLQHTKSQPLSPSRGAQGRSTQLELKA